MYNHLYGEIKEFEDERVNEVLAERIIWPNELEVMEAKKEAREQSKLSIALKLLAKNFSPEDIADATELPLERIQSLQAEAYAL